MMTLREVADELGITVQRVQQIEASALRKLKRNKEAYQIFNEYLMLNNPVNLYDELGVYVA